MAKITNMGNCRPGLPDEPGKWVLRGFIEAENEAEALRKYKEQHPEVTGLLKAVRTT